MPHAALSTQRSGIFPNPNHTQSHRTTVRRMVTITIRMIADQHQAQYLTRPWTHTLCTPLTKQLHLHALHHTCTFAIDSHIEAFVQYLAIQYVGWLGSHLLRPTHTTTEKDG